MKRRPRDLTLDDVNTIIQLKFGKMVDSQFHRAYLTNSALGKLFKCSAESIRQAYLVRFARNSSKNSKICKSHSATTLLKDGRPRKRFGIRFLTPENTAWLTASDTLAEHVGLSLQERCVFFHRRFPEKKINPTLLRKVYRIRGIKKKAIVYKKVLPPHIASKFEELKE